MDNKPSDIGHNDSEFVDLSKIFVELLNKKKFILIFTGCFFIASIAFALMTPNQFTSTATLTPSQSNNSMSLSSEFGGLASLAGIDIGGGNSSEGEVAFQIMKSWGFIEKFIRDNNLEMHLIAAKGWDASNNKLIIDNNIYDEEKGEWLNIKKNYKGEFPSSWSLYNSFNNKSVITRDRLSGSITVSFEFYSPFEAKEIIELYIQSINDYMRDRKLLLTEKNIQYLENEIQKTSMTRMREVFYKLIEEQTNIKMLAQATPDYVFNIVNKPMISEERSRPARSLIVLAFSLSGFLLAILLVLFREKLPIKLK